ncbi:hypothetical protein M407DRAFT_104065 [Tulasnella calospora MUT 4182]|uniref:Uncharacterized protein n=1 Tax=Tulasnella calospora MUT 4182 TaxID=1051891 RepID=A0A0C3QFK4_9AGAM|nr:hypothetical protein M407DRAFT_104065 [Tulasnella calospora MUT 4182]
MPFAPHEQRAFYLQLRQRNMRWLQWLYLCSWMDDLDFLQRWVFYETLQRLRPRVLQGLHRQLQSLQPELRGLLKP